MADILLTHSNHLYNDRKQVRKMQPYPPLQTLLAAACLRRAGVSRGAVRLHARTARGGVRAGAGAPSAAPGGRVRGQFQLPDQDVPAAQSRAGLLDGAHRAPGRSAGHRQRLRRHRPRRRVSGGRLRLRAGRRSGRGHRGSRAGCCWMAPAAGDSESRGLAFLDPRSGASAPHSAPRADRRPGFAAHAGLGPDRCRAVPRGVDIGARLFLAEHGIQPRLPVPLQLVRQADLGRHLPLPLGAPGGRRRCSKSRRASRPTTSGSPTTSSLSRSSGPTSSPKRWKRSARRFRSRCNRAAT